MLLRGESNIDINEHKLMLVFLNYSQENWLSGLSRTGLPASFGN